MNNSMSTKHLEHSLFLRESCCWRIMKRWPQFDLRGILKACLNPYISLLVFDITAPVLLKELTKYSHWCEILAMMGREEPIHYWWEGKLVQPLQKSCDNLNRKTLETLTPWTRYYSWLFTSFQLVPGVPDRLQSHEGKIMLCSVNFI
jgi:hypothetical protein